MKLSILDIPEDIKQSFSDEGIEELNPPQEKAVESGLMEGEDMVVASPTASGKTLIAELAMISKVKKQDQKAVYIVPLKALASEKYQDFSERYEDLNIQMSVGDYDDSGKSFETADVVIVTSEKLDSMLRHNPSWIHEIGLVIVDELHLLTSPDRGPTLEVTLARLRDVLDFQMLGLSATISNSGELAEWLDAELVESSYRPVDLEHGIYWDDEVEYYSEDADPSANTGGKLTEKLFSKGSEVKKEKNNSESENDTTFIPDKHGRGTMNLMDDTLGKEKQAIVFCSSRKGAEKSSDRLASVTENDLSREEKEELERYGDRIENVLGSPTSQCKRMAENVRKGAAFHHAGAVNEQRKLVEKAFREGLIRCVSATPTLAAGLNLPAYRVIMRDLKRYTGRGMEYIPVLEYEQMTGRAGRPKYDDRGEAISIAKDPGMKEEILDRYIAGEPEKIQSKLNAEPVLRMHILSLVASGFTPSMEDLLEFFGETFYAFQFGDIDKVEANIKSVVSDLRDYGFIQKDELSPTEVGKRVSELYIDPDSANHILQSLENASDQQTKPISYLFMLARTTEMTPRLRVKKGEREKLEEFLEDASDYLLEEVPEEWDPAYDLYLGSLKTALMMKGWIEEEEEEELMEKYGVSPGGIRAKMQNADWLIYASKELARMEEIEVKEELNEIGLRLDHGIKKELLPLVKYDQIGRVRARKLFDNGISSKEDIREASFEKVKKLIGKRTAEKLKKQVGQENIFDRENIMDYYD